MLKVLFNYLPCHADELAFTGDVAGVLHSLMALLEIIVDNAESSANLKHEALNTIEGMIDRLFFLCTDGWSAPHAVCFHIPFCSYYQLLARTLFTRGICCHLQAKFSANSVRVLYFSHCRELTGGSTSLL